VRIVNVPLGERSYVIKVGTGLLNALGRECGRAFVGKRCAIISDAKVAPLFGRRVKESLGRAGFESEMVVVPAGERSKSLKSVQKCYDQLAGHRLERKSFIVALGGGVVGDLAGFVAATYLRGIPFVQVPTTLLAQVDSSVGGKVGVNLKAGKNLVGTFHHPRMVLIDPAVLATLPDREFRAGLYEALKCGVIGKPELFHALERVDVKELRRDAAKLEWVIAESVRLKAEVVASDEREHGLRRVLNFGHTIGHALEAETQYRHFLHGEAVAWGMIAAAKIAASVKKTDEASAGRIADAVRRLGSLPEVRVSSRNILRLLKSDKKTRDGVVHFVLPREIGKVEVVNNVPEQVVSEAVEELRRLSK